MTPLIHLGAQEHLELFRHSLCAVIVIGGHCSDMSRLLRMNKGIGGLSQANEESGMLDARRRSLSKGGNYLPLFHRSLGVSESNGGSAGRETQGYRHV